MVMTTEQERFDLFTKLPEFDYIMKQVPAKHKKFVLFVLEDLYTARDRGHILKRAVEELTLWIDGLNGLTPTSGPLQTAAQHFARKQDPEYAKYLELKKKFGD